MSDRTKQSSAGRSRLVPGAPVYDAAGEMVGTVDAESQERDALIVRQSAMFPHDLDVPLKAITRMEPDGVYLNLSRRALRGKRYTSPPRAEHAPASASNAVEAPRPSETAEVGQASRIAVPLASEELVARRTPMREGIVRLHKGVETREQTFAVPITRDEVIVEHIPPDQLDANATVGENELLIPIMEEQVVVQKRMVVKEYVRVRKRQVVEQRQVRAPVRREVLGVEQMPEGNRGQPERPLVRETQGPLAEEIPGASAGAGGDASP